MPVHYAYGDVLFEPLQGTNDQGTMRPRAGVGNIEMIAVGFGRQVGGGAGDLVAEGTGEAVEFASFGVLWHPVGDFTFLGGRGLVDGIVTAFDEWLAYGGHDCVGSCYNWEFRWKLS